MTLLTSPWTISWLTFRCLGVLCLCHTGPVARHAARRAGSAADATAQRTEASFSSCRLARVRHLAFLCSFADSSVPDLLLPCCFCSLSAPQIESEQRALFQLGDANNGSGGRRVRRSNCPNPSAPPGFPLPCSPCLAFPSAHALASMPDTPRAVRSAHSAQCTSSPPAFGCARCCLFARTGATVRGDLPGAAGADDLLPAVRRPRRLRVSELQPFGARIPAAALVLTIACGVCAQLQRLPSRALVVGLVALLTSVARVGMFSAKSPADRQAVQFA